MKIYFYFFVFLITLFQAPPNSLAWTVNLDLIQIDGFPENGSLEYKKDYEELFEFQRTRTAEECKFADLQSIPAAMYLMGPQTGVLSPEEFSVVKTFADKLTRVVSKISNPLKDEFQRVRPYNQNTNIRPCIKKPGGNTSYPSSHAAMGEVLGFYLSKIYVAKREQILNQGKIIGENRILGGVHHRSDVEAGRSVARQIIEQLNSNSEFLNDFKLVKKAANGSGK